MQYREDKKSKDKLSILGYGCMRLPGSLGRIDKIKSEALLMKAYHEGVNYFDTAYIYPGSEEAVGEIIAKNGIREKIHIATKLPHAGCKNRQDFDKYFNEQKRRLRTDYIDYYLMHNISSFSQWQILLELGIEDWIAEKKKVGEIRQVGFSFHGSQKDFFLMIDAYEWDFVQIQYNYININYQAGEAGLKYAHAKGLPVIIMEPLLGGRLANGLPEEVAQIMQENKKDSTPVSWALNWLWNQPEVTVVLSGMGEEKQLEENLALADSAYIGMLGKEEEQVIQKSIEAFNANYKIRCTGCNYCMPCPKGINIPGCFSAYNTSYVVGWKSGIMQYVVQAGVSSKNPRFIGDCIECGKCEKHCPQNIEIRKELKKVKRRFELPGIRGISKIARRFMS